MIVTTIEQIKTVLTNLAAEIEYPDFETYIQSSETWLKNDILGVTLYDKIDNEIITDEILIRLCVNVTVLKAYETGIPFMDLVQTGSGFGVVKDSKRAPASQQRVERLIKQNKVRRDTETEWLFNYLEDTPDLHTDWKSSAAYSILSDCLVRTAREFKRYVKFEGNRKEFLLLKPSLINISTIKLEPELSKAYVAELIEKQNAGTLSNSDKVVLPGIKQALANFTMEKDHFGKRLLDDVVTIMDNDLGNYPSYRDSAEKENKDDPGYENSEEDSVFVFKGGI